MNYSKLFLCITCSLTIQSSFAIVEISLSPEELQAKKWFEQTKTALDWSYKNLPQEDQDIFKQGLHYSDNPEALTQVMQHFVAGFYKRATDLNVPLPYDQSTTTSMLVKRKSEVAARIFVFSQLLTPQERATIARDNYTKNKEAALVTMTKLSHLLAQEFARVDLIENTDEAKKQAAHQFTQNKMAELEGAFSN